MKTEQLIKQANMTIKVQRLIALKWHDAEPTFLEIGDALACNAFNAGVRPDHKSVNNAGDQLSWCQIGKFTEIQKLITFSFQGTGEDRKVVNVIIRR